MLIICFYPPRPAPLSVCALYFKNIALNWSGLATLAVSFSGVNGTISSLFSIVRARILFNGTLLEPDLSLLSPAG